MWVYVLVKLLFTNFKTLRPHFENVFRMDLFSRTPKIKIFRMDQFWRKVHKFAKFYPRENLFA